MHTIKGIIIILIVLIFTELTIAQNITINISSIRSAKGTISIMAFKDSVSFENKKPYKRFVIDKNGLKDGKISTKINLPAGVYGISALDDENKNRKMDFNFIGYPLEGFGFSNYYLKGLSKPKFSAFTVTIPEGKNISVDIKFRYL